MNSSRRSSKAVIIFVLVFTLMLTALTPMMVMGSSSKKDTSSDYQYYSVKSGDTLTRIAKNYGVTISDIMTANNLSNADKIVSGTVLKVPISSSSSSTTESSLVTTRLSMNLVDADVRDVLSAIAINAGYTIIFADDTTQTLTVNLEEMTVLKAIDYVTRLAGITYLKDGNTIMVGSVDTLNSTFVDKTVLSKFTLKYITATALQSQASSLGLSSVQYVSTEENQKTVYVTAYPKEMAKLKELIKILDVSSNIMVGSEGVTDNFTSIDLTYIDAAEFNTLLSSLGLSQGIVLSSRPYTLYVYVTGDALRDIKTIKNVVDKPLSGMNLASENATSVGTGDAATTNSSGSGVTQAPTTQAPATTQAPTTTTSELTLSAQQFLINIDVPTATSILSSLGLNVTLYTNDKFTKTYWLLGSSSDIDKAIAAINNIDAVTPAITESFVPINLTNCTASEMIDRLASVTGLTGVTYKTTSDPATSHTLIVYATADMMQTVKDVIAKFDTANLNDPTYTPDVGWVVIESNTSSAIGTERVNTLKNLYSTYLGTIEFNVIMSTGKDGNPKYITYAKTSQETADYIKALLQQMDAA